jgi:hypothetical protein
MRTPPRCKPFHRKLLICSILAGLFVVPTAFAHGHHGGSANSNARHGGFGHHRLASSNGRTDVREGIDSRDGDDRSTAALDAGSRRHQRVPDEEEVEQAEQ